MGQMTWSYIFQPTDREGGLKAVSRALYAREFDSFETYVDSTALQAVWTETGTSNNPTLVTGANALYGGKSLQLVMDAGGTLYRALPNATFGYPFGGAGRAIRYVRFKGTVSGGTTNQVRVQVQDASDATNYRYWTVTLDTDKHRDIVVDLNPDNTESHPAPVEGATWNPALIDRFGFYQLENGATYKFDDIIFYYEVSVTDLIGFGTEPPSALGNDGSLHARLNSVHGDVKSLIGRTEQFEKQGISQAEVGDSLTWTLELLSDFAPPTTTEIVPGNYQIDRVRHGVTTNIVASTPASESAGAIYASYQPAEDSWTEGDLLKVTFSGGYVRTDTAPSAALTANADAGQANLSVTNAYEFQVGQLVRVYDNNDLVGEWGTVLSLPAPTTITLTGNLAGAYTTAASATVTRVVRTDLDTAVFFTRLTREPTDQFRLVAVLESDHEEGDWAAAGDTAKWDFQSYNVGAGGGTQSGNINTTVAGKVYLKIDPDDGIPAAGDYAARNKYSTYSKYYRAVVDLTATFGAGIGASGGAAGLAVYKGTAYDANNYVEVKLYEDTVPTDGIRAVANFGGAGASTQNFATVDDATALMIERQDRTWRAYYSLTMFPDYEWTLLAQWDDSGDNMGEQTSVVLFVQTGGDAGTATVQGDFDNFKFLLNTRFLEQIYNQPAIVPIVEQQADPRVDQNTPGGIEIFRIGLMDIRNGLPTVAEITPGTTLVDRFREGTDADWTNQAAETITNGEANGYINAAYDFPNATWQPGDQARFRLSGVIVTDATTGRVYTVPDLSIYFIVGGPPNQDYVGDLWQQDVVGGKTDTADYTATATQSSIVRFLKGLLGVTVIAEGTFTTSSATVPADTGRAEANDFFNGSYVMPVAGAVAFQPRLVTDFANAGGVFTLDPEQPFTAAPGLVAYVVLSPNSQLVPAADGTNNSTPAHVAGNKSDVAAVGAGTASIIARLRAIEAALSVNAAGGGEFELDGDPDLWDALVNNSSADANITTLTGNRDAAVIQRLAALINALGITDAATLTGYEEDGSGANLFKTLIAVQGEADAGSDTNTLIDAAVLTQINNYWQGGVLLMLSGNNAGLARPIVSSDQATTAVEVRDALPNAIAAGNAYAILALHEPVVPAADGDENLLPRDVIGNKADAVDLTAAQASIVGLLRSIIAALSVTAAGGGEFEIDGVPNLWDALVLDSSAAAAIISLTGNRDGAIIERLSAIINALNITNSGSGSGLEEDGSSNIVTALGTDGVTVTDSAVSVLGAVGANNGNNAFDSSSVAENGDGSTLERLEELRGRTATGTHNREVADGTTEVLVADITPIRHGRIAVELDLNTLVAAVEGGTVIVRLKSMIDGVTLRTVDRADFLVGTDEVHPTVSGWVYEGANTARVTIQTNAAVSAQRAIPYRIIEAS